MIPEVPDPLSQATELLFSGRWNEAEQLFQKVVSVEPSQWRAWMGLGLIAKQRQQLADAAQCFERVLELEPTVADAYSNLGHVHRQRGNLAAAAECYRRGVEFAPDQADMHLNLGAALQGQRAWQAAIACYRQALALDPNHAAAHCNLGTVLKEVGQPQEAIECFRRALELRPSLAEAHNNLGSLLLGSGRMVEAIAELKRALAIRPDYAEAQSNLGTAWLHGDRPDDAVACFRAALVQQPKSAALLTNLGVALRERAELSESLSAFTQAIAADASYSPAHSNYLFTLHFHPAYDAAAIGQEHRRWNELMARPLMPTTTAYANEVVASRRLRIGYLGSSFRNHCQSLFMAPLLGAHDRAEVEAICYADVARPDGHTHKLRGLADGWRNVFGLTDEQVAECVKGDRVDLLVDLTMHMENSRWGVFARRPAPVQVAWLAYPGTTGLTAVDYRISDVFLDPSGAGDGGYAERTVRLPETFWCFDPLVERPLVGDLPALASGHITFGSLNSFSKVNQLVLELWAGVLKSVAGSRFILLAPEGECRERVLHTFSEQGITGERVSFVGRQPREKYLETYRKIDIALDTLPANGHTTSLEALWMGVPVMTLAGRTAIGRGGVSILSNVGLPELIARSGAAYIQIARQLAADRERLSKIRAGLRDRMQRSPLMNAPRLARNLEAAYRAMWRSWCAEQAR